VLNRGARHPLLKGLRIGNFNANREKIIITFTIVYIYFDPRIVPKSMMIGIRVEVFHLTVILTKTLVLYFKSTRTVGLIFANNKLYSNIFYHQKGIDMLKKKCIFDFAKKGVSSEY